MTATSEVFGWHQEFDINLIYEPLKSYGVAQHTVAIYERKYNARGGCKLFIIHIFIDEH